MATSTIPFLSVATALLLFCLFFHLTTSSRYMLNDQETPSIVSFEAPLDPTLPIPSETDQTPSIPEEDPILPALPISFPEPDPTLSNPNPEQEVAGNFTPVVPSLPSSSPQLLPDLPPLPFISTFPFGPGLDNSGLTSPPSDPELHI